jgi:hypothetical protein
MKDFIEWVTTNIKHIGLREALIRQELAFAWEMAARYLAGDEATRSDIEMLFEPMADDERTPEEWMRDQKDL